MRHKWEIRWRREKKEWSQTRGFMSREMRNRGIYIWFSRADFLYGSRLGSHVLCRGGRSSFSRYKIWFRNHAEHRTQKPFHEFIRVQSRCSRETCPMSYCKINYICTCIDRTCSYVMHFYEQSHTDSTRYVHEMCFLHLSFSRECHFYFPGILIENSKQYALAACASPAHRSRTPCARAR